MGNSGQNGSRQSRKNDSTRTSKSDREFQGVVPKESSTYPQNMTHHHNSSSKKYVKQIKTPLCLNSVFDASQKEESCDMVDSEERPPLNNQKQIKKTTNKKCILLAHEFEFLNFKKTINEREEVSLLIDAHCGHDDLLQKQMSEFETRVSPGCKLHQDEDEDIISMEEFRNIIPFRYSESKSSDNLSDSSFQQNKPRTSF